MAVQVLSVTGCVFLLLLSSARPTVSTRWWSLGVVDKVSLKVIDQSNVLCNELHDVLNTTDQQSFCNYNKAPLNYIAVGTRNGIVACQEEFADSLWNCTTFNGQHLFGSFVDNDTSETAVVNALLAAGGIRQLAAACREEDLRSNCTCKTLSHNGIEDGSFITYGCAYDTDFGERAMLQFLNQSTTSPSLAVAHHNHKVGAHFTKQLRKKCRCNGFSGACSTQVCYYKSNEMETIAAGIRNAYKSASIQVSVSISDNRATITPEVSGERINTTDLVYLTSSRLCLPNSKTGVLSTVGRPCNVSSSAQDSCDALCCGRGHKKIITTRPKECCQFVFCCRIECTQCGTETITTYKCK